MKVNYKKYFYILVLSILLAFVTYVIELKYDFIKKIDADWLSALSTFIAVPVSVFSLAFQIRRGNNDRRYDARTTFSFTWREGIFRQGVIWVHDNENGAKIKNKRNRDNTVGEERNLYPTLENVGGKLAQEVLLEFECVNGVEYFSKSIIKYEEKFSVFLDTKMTEKCDLYSVNIYYLSELGERIKFNYNIKSKIMRSELLSEDEWRKKKQFFSNSNTMALAIDPDESKKK